jgi:hypothetical protein
MPSTDSDGRRSPVWYWVLSGVLIGFGMISILTIGAAFVLVGGTLAALAPVRRRPRIFWPVLAIVLGFLTGYVAVAPWGCSQSFSATSTDGVVTTSTSPVECSSLAGVEYSGTDGYEPPLTPGLLAGLAVGGLAGIVAFVTASVAVAGDDHRPS